MDLPTIVVTHRLQAERRVGEVRRLKADILPHYYATNLATSSSWLTDAAGATCEYLNILAIDDVAVLGVRSL